MAFAVLALPGAVTLFAALPAAAAQVTAGCAICHVDVVDDVAQSGHANAPLDCITCHGRSQAHIEDENNTVKPDRIYPRDRVDAHCGACHPCTRTHRREPPRRVCTECHGKHADFPAARSAVLTRSRDGSIAIRSAHFAGQTFGLALPESLWEDGGQRVWPRSSPARPTWQPGRKPSSLVAGRQVDGIMRWTASAVPHDERVHVRIEVSNLSQRTWARIAAVTALRFDRAPALADLDLARTLINVGGDFMAIAETDRSWGKPRHNAYLVDAPLTPTAVRMLRPWTIRHERPDVGLICATSTDGDRLVGLAWEAAHSVAHSAEPGHARLHVTTLLRDIAPGETAVARGSVYLGQATPEDWLSALAAPYRP